MKAPTLNAPKRTLSPRPGVTVVENLPKAKPSPAMQARIDEAREQLRQAKLPEGWREGN